MRSFTPSTWHPLAALLAASTMMAAPTLRAQNDALSDEELAAAPPATASGTVDGSSVPLEITWDDLLPAGEMARLEALYNEHFKAQLNGGDIAEGSPEDVMTQIGTFGTVSELDSSLVRIPGFIVPLDFRLPEPGQPNRLSEFLLVPYFGACVHSPPPPPNQIVYVSAEPPIAIDRLWDPMTVQGVLRTGRKDTSMANAAYTLTLEKIEVYEF
jgi:hypothetical protein